MPSECSGEKKLFQPNSSNFFVGEVRPKNLTQKSAEFSFFGIFQVYFHLDSVLCYENQSYLKIQKENFDKNKIKKMIFSDFSPFFGSFDCQPTNLG